MSATNRGAIRRESDFYATPLSAFTPLLPYVPTGYRVWEPASGDGRLIRAMNDARIHATGDDIRNEIRPYNFLEDATKHECVLTNPPYSLAFEFCQHAVAHADEVFMLLRLNFLASRKRAAWFKANEPSALFILSARPCFTDNGKTDATDYAWYFWGNRHKGIIHL